MGKSGGIATAEWIWKVHMAAWKWPCASWFKNGNYCYTVKKVNEVKLIIRIIKECESIAGKLYCRTVKNCVKRINEALVVEEKGGFTNERACALRQVLERVQEKKKKKLYSIRGFRNYI